MLLIIFVFNEVIFCYVCIGGLNKNPIGDVDGHGDTMPRHTLPIGYDENNSLKG